MSGLVECRCIYQESSTNERHLFLSPTGPRVFFFYVVIRAMRRSSRLQNQDSYFKTLSIGPASGIEPATSRITVKRSTDLASQL